MNSADLLNCIFCGNSFEADFNQEGEHVIPKSIFGFWRIYDVCPECRRVFGNDTDQLAVKDVEILNALDSLDLKNPAAYYRDIPFKGIDSITKESVRMVLRGHSSRLAVTKTSTFIKCGEELIPTVGRKWLWSRLRDQLSKQQFDREFEELLSQYCNLPVGATIRFHDYTIWKGQVISQGVDCSSLPSTTPLIAKIMVCALHHILPRKEINKITDINKLSEHARSIAQLGSQILFRFGPPENDFHRLHWIELFTYRAALVADVVLFGHVCWRCVLRTKEEIQRFVHQTKPIEGVQLVLNFEDPAKPAFAWGILHLNSDNFLHFRVEPVKLRGR
jgi:hypothetical protein